MGRAIWIAIRRAPGNALQDDMEGLDLDGRRGPVRRGAQEELERCDLDGFGGEQLAGYAHGRYRRREKRYVCRHSG